MAKTPLVIAALMLLSVPAAYAQVPATQPNGVTGAAPTKDVGSGPNAKDSGNGTTTSTSMEMQRQKKDNAQGVPTTTNSNTK
jgi:hypothetical protein